MQGARQTATIPIKNRCARSAALALVPFLLAGCGGFSVWPFGDSRSTEASRKPADATEYRCDGAKGFFVRPLDAGAVWLIAPDREIRLTKTRDVQGARYVAGRVVLEITGETATLLDPPANFSGCKRAAAPRSRRGEAEPPSS